MTGAGMIGIFVMTDVAMEFAMTIAGATIAASLMLTDDGMIGMRGMTTGGGMIAMPETTIDAGMIGGPAMTTGDGTIAMCETTAGADKSRPPNR
jgi:hypothetical protein